MKKSKLTTLELKICRLYIDNVVTKWSSSLQNAELVVLQASYTENITGCLKTDAHLYSLMCNSKHRKHVTSAFLFCIEKKNT
jgi:hypothetical protein